MRRWAGLWLGLVLGFGLALGLNIGAARAGAKPAHAPAKLVLPRPDPPGHWRYMTQNPATTTSKCVGQVTNPMCAVDTLLACFLRNDDDLCRIALGLHKPTGWASGSHSPKDWYKYRVLWAGRKPIGQLTPRQEAFYRNWRLHDHPWPPGDMKITLQIVECDAKFCAPRRQWNLPTDFLLQPIAEGWRVLSWFERCYPQDVNAPGCW